MKTKSKKPFQYLTLATHELYNALYHADNVEVHPVIEFEGGICEQCGPKDASFWSVYAHLVKGGLCCLADCPNEEEANTLAKTFMQNIRMGGAK